MATPASAFLDHFSFLCSNDEDRELLEALASRVEAFSNDGGAVTFAIGGEKVVCDPRFEGVPHESTPKSYAALASHHNGIYWDSIGGGRLGYFGLNTNGHKAFFGFFDGSYLEDGDNEEFLGALDAAGLSVDDIDEAYGCGQNWIVFDPLRQNAHGEPALAFISHGSCDWEPILSADSLTAAGVTLRLLAYYFADINRLPEIYC